MSRRRHVGRARPSSVPPRRHGLEILVDALDARTERGERFYLTILAHDAGPMSFASDNWRHLAKAARQVVNRERRGGEAVVAVIVRRFDDPPAPGRMPRKSLAAFHVVDGAIHPLDAEEMRLASETDNETGRPLEPEPLVTYLDALAMLPEIAFAAVSEARPRPSPVP